MASDRCPTSSGSRFQCDEAVGHAGECETREPSRPWVGPASRLTRGVTQVVTALPAASAPVPSEEVPHA